MLDPLQLVALDSPVNQESRKVVSRSNKFEQVRRVEPIAIPIECRLIVIYLFVCFCNFQYNRMNCRI